MNKTIRRAKQLYRRAETHRSNLGRQLLAALKGPRDCTVVEIRHAVGEIPTVTYTCIIKDNRKLVRVGEIIRRYEFLLNQQEVVPLPLP